MEKTPRFFGHGAIEFSMVAQLLFEDTRVCRIVLTEARREASGVEWRPGA
jgi:hypothetical protein